MICGSEEDFSRFHVIPSVYRHFFPNELKAHKSHDVVIVCYICREKADRLYEQEKIRLSEFYNVPLIVKIEEKEKLIKVINTAKFLCSNFIKMPHKIKKEKLEDILEFINNKVNQVNYKDLFNNKWDDFSKIPKSIEEIHIGILQKIKNWKDPGENSEGNLHGKLILEKFEKQEDFIKLWRKFFLDSLKPKFLPEDWKIGRAHV